MTDVAVETLWLVEATYAPDGAETRTPFRPAHLAGIGERLSDGRYAMAGAFTDVSSTIILVRAETEAEAIALVGDDIYLRNGVWVEMRARPFGMVTVSSTTRS